MTKKAKSAPKRPREKTPRARREHAEVPEVEARPLLLSAALAGRGAEFGGVALIGASVLVALSVYLDRAGPLGSVVAVALATLVGFAQYLAAPAALLVGVSLVRRGSADHRVRLTFGVAVIAAAVLGVVHVLVASRDDFEVERLRDAGGAVGWLLGQPLVGLIGRLAGVLVLVVVAFVGLLIATGASPVELVRRIRSWIAEADDEPAEGSGAQFVDAWADGLLEEVGDDRTADEDEEKGDEYLADGDADVIDDELAEEELDDSDDEETDDIAGEPMLAPKKPRRRRTREPDDYVRGEEQRFPLGPAAEPSAWGLPSLDLLGLSRNERADQRHVEERGRRLVEALSEHNVETELVGYTRGPTVTRYELALGGGVKVSKVTSLSRDIAYTMAATDVRILAPIPGRSAIGIEVPNTERELVSLGDLLASTEAKAARHPLEVAVGKDIAGRAVFLNLSTTPHLLIAGTTGAGKSSALNCIITSILMRSTPEQVKMILIDPKQVEMSQYAHLPHLLTPPVTNPKKAANALGWAVREMERRYDLLVEAGFRDVVGYNAAYDKGDLNADGATFQRLPYVLVVVDELNDLMMVAARDVEECITRIAQKARAVGVHLIVATQRPSVNVITGVIKANIPARMAFAVSSLTDSRVILDQPGAEKLVGRGDMLLLPGNTSVAQRLQSAWVEEGEVRKVVAHWRRQAPEIVYVSGVDGEKEGGEGTPFGGSTGDAEDDDLLRQAMELVVRSRQGSTSMLQRKLKVGFARAGRLMDLLEERGVVGPSEGSKSREVLMTVEELEAIAR